MNRVAGSMCRCAVVVAVALLAGYAATAVLAQVSAPSPAHQATNVPTSTALSWSADPRASRYDVYLGTTDPPPLVARNTSATMFQPATPLVGSTAYFWRIVARGPKNYSLTGPLWRFTTAAPAAPPPSVPTAASPQPGATSVAITTTLSWAPSANATTYDVAFGTTSTPAVVSAGQSATSFTPAAPLSFSQTYYWRVIARGSGGSTEGPLWSFTTESAEPPPPSTHRDRLRVLTWNVQSSRNAAGASAVDAQVALLADAKADVLVLQEVTITPDYGDLTVLYKSKLEALTGQTWYQVWAPAPRSSTFTPEGNLILTTLPILASATTQFDSVPDDPASTDAKRSAAAVTIVVNDVQVTVITTHLPVDANQRQNHLNLLQQWAAGFTAPRVIGGDFNTLPGDSVHTDMAGDFADTWMAVAGATEYGYTNDVRNVAPFQPGRIDYWWQEIAAARARATEVWVVKTARSDHHAVVMDVEVK